MAVKLRQAAWTAPNITSLANLARARYERSRDAGLVQAKLLSNHQQHLLFRDSAPPATAHLVGLFETAWEQLHLYRLDLEDTAFVATENGACFRTWTQQVRTALRHQNALTQVQLLDQEELWEDFHITFTGDSELCRVGFDVLTTQQQQWFDGLSQRGLAITVEEDTPPAAPATVTTVAFPNDGQELTHAISWASELLASNAADTTPPRIGIVVPELNRQYARVRRLLRTKLDPAQHRAQGLFNIGGGITLNEQPAVASALQFFASIAAPQPHSAIAALLKSPYFPAIQTHKALPPNTGTQLRLVDTPHDLRRAALRDLIERIRHWPKEQSLVHWWQEAQTILLHSHWHEARSDSAGFQAVERFIDLLRLDSIDDQAGSVTWSAALAELTSLTSRSLFAEATRDAPIQVLGYLEALELQFDHLWIVGMSHTAWPAPVNLSPFLPPRVVRAANVPRSTHEGELAFAQRWLNKVTNNAPEVVVSYVADDDDADPGKLPHNSAGESIPPGLTPLLSHTNYRTAPLSPNTDSHPLLASGNYPADRTELFSDEHATPPAPGVLRGGTGRFEDQAQCPFRAWGIHGLGLRSETPPHSLPNALEQGNLIHRALDVLFEKLPSKTAVDETDTEVLAELCFEAAKTAAGKTIGRYPRSVRQAEIERAQSLLLNFLNFERARRDFTVIAREQKTTLQVGPYEITLQLDRVDQTEQGRVVLDYKTGMLKTKGLSDDRLTAPQLPLYVAAQSQAVSATDLSPLAGVFYAQLPISDPQSRYRLPYKGVADEDPLDSPRSLLAQEADWVTQCRIWTDQLTQLAAEIAAGLASVTPQKDACNYCHLERLCRIKLRTE